MSFYSLDELNTLGIKSIGRNVLISRKASIYGAANISIGSNVRIDDFCVLSAGDGGIEIGSHIHIAVYTSIIGAGKVVIKDFANISSRVAIYSSNDDYSGASMTNPMVPEKYTNVTHSPVTIGKHVIIGSGSIVLPGIEIGHGCALGAMTLANKSLESWGVYVGQPAKRIRERSQQLLSLAEQLKAE